ncbi:unnamed protein product, partial [Prorocentrum cordatum]
DLLVALAMKRFPNIWNNDAFTIRDMFGTDLDVAQLKIISDALYTKDPKKTVTLIREGVFAVDRDPRNDRGDEGSIDDRAASVWKHGIMEVRAPPTLIEPPEGDDTAVGERFMALDWATLIEGAKQCYARPDFNTNKMLVESLSKPIMGCRLLFKDTPDAVCKFYVDYKNEVNTEATATTYLQVCRSTRDVVARYKVENPGATVASVGGQNKYNVARFKVAEKIHPGRWPNPTALTTMISFFDESKKYTVDAAAKVSVWDDFVSFSQKRVEFKHPFAQQHSEVFGVVKLVFSRLKHDHPDMITSVLAFGLPLKKRAGASAICEGVDRIKITDDMMLRLLSKQQQAVPDMGAPSFQFDADEADCDALDHWKHTVDRLVSIDSRQEDGIRSMMSIGLYMIMANTTSVELLVDGKVKKVKGWTELVRWAKLHVYKMAKLAPRVSDPDLVDGGDAVDGNKAIADRGWDMDRVSEFFEAESGTASKIVEFLAANMDAATGTAGDLPTNQKEATVYFMTASAKCIEDVVPDAWIRVAVVFGEIKTALGSKLIIPRNSPWEKMSDGTEVALKCVKFGSLMHVATCIGHQSCIISPPSDSRDGKQPFHGPLVQPWAQRASGAIRDSVDTSKLGHATGSASFSQLPGPKVTLELFADGRSFVDIANMFGQVVHSLCDHIQLHDANGYEASKAELLKSLHSASRDEAIAIVKATRGLDNIDLPANFITFRNDFVRKAEKLYDASHQEIILTRALLGPECGAVVLEKLAGHVETERQRAAAVAVKGPAHAASTAGGDGKCLPRTPPLTLKASMLKAIDTELKDADVAKNIVCAHAREIMGKLQVAINENMTSIPYKDDMYDNISITVEEKSTKGGAMASVAFESAPPQKSKSEVMYYWGRVVDDRDVKNLKKELAMPLGNGIVGSKGTRGPELYLDGTKFMNHLRSDFCCPWLIVPTAPPKNVTPTAKDTDDTLERKRAAAAAAVPLPTHEVNYKEIQITAKDHAGIQCTYHYTIPFLKTLEDVTPLMKCTRKRMADWDDSKFSKAPRKDPQ